MGFDQYLSDDFGNVHPVEGRDWNRWISASRTRNWCKRNPLQDWLHAHGDAAGFERDADPDPRTDFREFIFAKGHVFEAAVLALIARRVPVFTIDGFERPTQSIDACRQTFDAMTRGEQMIAQGVLWNPQNRTYGAADLLVRSDVLRSLFPGALSAAEASVGAPGLGLRDCHYRVIDIKYTTLKLDKYGNASSELLPYMAQVFLYNEALGRIQGFTPGASFLLGRGWTGPGGEQSRECLDRLAPVPHDGCGKRGTLESIVSDAIAWVRRVRTEGRRWHPVNGPTVPELRPNPGESDFPWTNATKLIAQQTRDPILAWQVGCDGREQAAAAGITGWTDPGFSSAVVGLNGSRGVRLDAILDINRDPSAPAVSPARIKAERETWIEPQGVEFFVDFETVSDLNDDFRLLPARGGQAMIYMIGCGHVEDGHWRFECFVAERLSAASEADIIEAWLDHMETVRQRVAPYLAGPLVFHWSPAESSGLTNGLKSARTRHSDRSKAWKEPRWFDFLGNVMRAEPVVVKGQMGFGLKTVAKSLERHGLIETEWADSVTDGLGAMVGAWWCYDEAEAAGVPVRNVELMGEIGCYNEVDCRVMMETLAYLRRHR